ncbi:hypothetical protein FACS1894110_19580 [Spirochaetia bacterium]|nr:hypothetical protein FACS1894110_19580 [Spirochaetia bacterium]
MRTFYEISQVIDGPKTKRVLADPVYGISSSELPAALKIYARQKDLTFGDNIYQYEYRVEADFLVFIQENLTTMNAGIIRAMAHATSLPSLRERIGNSFTNHAEAILKWYAGQADKAFTAAGR